MITGLVGDMRQSAATCCFQFRTLLFPLIYALLPSIQMDTVHNIAVHGQIALQTVPLDGRPLDQCTQWQDRCESGSIVLRSIHDEVVALICVSAWQRSQELTVLSSRRHVAFRHNLHILPPFSENFLHVCSAVLMTDTSFVKTVTPRDSVHSAFGPQLTVAVNKIQVFLVRIQELAFVHPFYP